MMVYIFRMHLRCIHRRIFRCLNQDVTTPFPEFSKLNTHSELYNYSITNPDEFWARVARSQLHFFKDFTTTREFDLARGRIEWFKGFFSNLFFLSIFDFSIYLTTTRMMT